MPLPIIHNQPFMPGYHVALESATLANNYFRQVLFTGPNSQLVLMTLQGGEEIGLETHANHDQFIRVEAGTGKAVMDGVEYDLKDGDAIVIPAGTAHNVWNISPDQPMKLYTVYAPPEHPDGTVNKTKADGDAYAKARGE